jgi:hypothetical protein
MKNSEVDIDELIKQALTEEESEHLKLLHKEQNVFEELLASFEGTRKWLSVYVTVVIFVVFGLSIYSLVQFLSVEGTREMILWGAATGGSLLIVTMLKVWYWMQMDRNAIIREIKRLELQIAALKKQI